MRIEKEITAALSQEEGARNPFITLYNRKTGKSQSFHAVDAREVLKLHSHQWSKSPVVIGDIETVEVVKQSKEAPIIKHLVNEEKDNTTETPHLSELTESMPSNDESVSVRRRRK